MLLQPYGGKSFFSRVKLASASRFLALVEAHRFRPVCGRCHRDLAFRRAREAASSSGRTARDSSTLLEALEIAAGLVAERWHEELQRPHLGDAQPLARLDHPRALRAAGTRRLLTSGGELLQRGEPRSTRLGVKRSSYAITKSFRFTTSPTASPTCRHRPRTASMANSLYCP